MMPDDEAKVRARARAKRYRDANKEKIAASAKSYYERNKNECQARANAWHAANREKSTARNRAWREANPERFQASRKAYNEANRAKIRAQHVERTFGLTLEAQRELVAAHKGCCAICSGPGGVHGLGVDHDHDTGEVRGLLCSSCNQAIGLMKDSPLRLRAAAAYLDKRQPKLRLVAT